MTALPTLRPHMAATRVFLIALITLGGCRQAASQARDSTVARTTQGRDSVPACCTIVRVDSRRSMITARELATGFTFRFQRKDGRPFMNLKPGQPVWVDFTARTVRLTANPDTPCCVIVPPDTP